MLRPMVKLDAPAQEVTYTNWRGETRGRWVTPTYLFWGSTEWHPEPQWLVSCYCHEDKRSKDFALSGFAGGLKLEQIEADTCSS